MFHNHFVEERSSQRGYIFNHPQPKGLSMFDFMYNSPSGALLSILFGSALLLGVGCYVFLNRGRISVLPGLGMTPIGFLLVGGGIGVRAIEHEFESHLNGFNALPITPLLLAMAPALVVGAMLIAAIRSGFRREWVEMFEFGTVLAVAGTVLTEAGFYRFYTDSWALANGICWLMTGGTAIAALNLMARSMLAYRRLMRPSNPHYQPNNT